MPSPAPVPASFRFRPAALGVTAVLLATLGLASWPYLEAYLNRPPGTRFYAVPVANYSDANQYLAFTRLVLEGDLLIGDPFTTEPHQPRLFMPLIYFQALLCRAFGWDVFGAFQATRVLSGALLLLAGWWFGSLLIRVGRQRRLFLGLMCFSAGFGWVVDRFGWEARHGLQHGDASQPEANTLFTLGNLPHLALSSALLTAIFAALLAYRQQPRRRWLAFTAACSFLLAWTHPFDFLALGLGLGAYGAVLLVESLRAGGTESTPRRLAAALRPSILHGAALFLGALPAAAYLAWLTGTDPVYRQLASDTLDKNRLHFYALQHGLLWAPAALVLFRAPLRRRYALPLCWVLLVFLFLLTPWRLGGKQPRVVGGVHVPLCVLAAVGVDWAVSATRRRAARARRRPALAARRLARGIAAVAFFLVAARGGWWLLQRQSHFYGTRAWYYYLDPSIQRLLTHLRDVGDDSQVSLGGTLTGGWAVVLADTTAFHGHWHMTLRALEKRRERDWFFLAPGEEARKAAWLRARRVTWVIEYGPEWEFPLADLQAIPGLRPVFAAPEARLYRFD
jgi:hypothetical protein